MLAALRRSGAPYQLSAGQLVAQTLGEDQQSADESTPGAVVSAEDPRARAVATLVIAACDGLAVQWLLDPDGSPSAGELAEGLALVLDASLRTGATGTQPVRP